MKKQRRKPSAKKKTTTTTQAPAAPAKADRRAFLGKLGYGAAGVALLGGVGVYTVTGFRASMAELDLGKIGNGVPTIVQVHDPQCQLCQQLQRATRDALSGFEPDALQYLVANINTDDGRAFAATHGVSHVTLVLFDGEGNRGQIITGVQSVEFLATAFAAHLQATAQS